MDGAKELQSEERRIEWLTERKATEREGALWDVNDRHAEGSVVRASEAWICAYFVRLGAMEPDPKNQDTLITVAGVPVHWPKELFWYPLWAWKSFEKGQRQYTRMGLMSMF